MDNTANYAEGYDTMDATLIVKMQFECGNIDEETTDQPCIEQAFKDQLKNDPPVKSGTDSHEGSNMEEKKDFKQAKPQYKLRGAKLLKLGGGYYLSKYHAN